MGHGSIPHDGPTKLHPVPNKTTAGVTKDMVCAIKPMMLIRKSYPCSVFPLLLSELSFTIFPLP